MASGGERPDCGLIGDLSQDFEKAVYGLIDYFIKPSETDDFKKKVKDMMFSSTRESVVNMLTEKFINLENGNKDKVLLTFVAGKTKDKQNKEQYLLQTQSMVLSYVKAVLKRQASPIDKDENGSNAIHHAVQRGFKEVVSILLESGEPVLLQKDLKLKTPLRLALDNSDDEIAALIVKSLPTDKVHLLFLADDKSDGADYSFCDILENGLTKTALGVLEKMMKCVDKSQEKQQLWLCHELLKADESGRRKSHEKFKISDFTAFELTVLTKNEKVACYRPVKLLIQQKWKAVGRKAMILKLGAFLLSVLFMTFAAVSGVMAPDPKRYDTPLDGVRAFCEVAALIGVIVKGCGEIFEILSYKLYYLKDFTNYFDLASILCFVAVVPLRWTDNPEQWYMFAVGYLIWVFNVFKYAAISRMTYDYSQALKWMVYGVFPQFIIMFLVILVAFSGSFLLALRGENLLDKNVETSNYWNILFTGLRILIEGQPVVDYAGKDGYKVLSTILMTAFLFVTIVVLLNILIAQLTDTHKIVQENMEGRFLLARMWTIIKIEWLFAGCRFVDDPEKTDLSDTEEWSSDEDEDTQLDIIAVNTNLKEIKETLKDITKRLEHNTTEQGRSVGFRPGHST